MADAGDMGLIAADVHAHAEISNLEEKSTFFTLENEDPSTQEAPRVTFAAIAPSSVPLVGGMNPSDGA